MTAPNNVKAAIATACRNAAVEMGSDLRGLSWFYRNTVRSTAKAAEKEAA